MFTSIYQAFLQLLFPPRCPSCNAYQPHPGQWCPHCMEELIRCDNLPYAPEIRTVISPIIAIGQYNKGLRHLIHELKYQRNFSTLDYLPPFFSALDQDWEFTSYDLFIPVPLFANKLSQRGFNQVDKIFQPWLAMHHRRLTHALQRIRATEHQYTLDYTQRQHNLAEAFVLADNVVVKDCKCLLLDDIFTTGSTLKHCAQVLLDNGATTVSGLVLASNANI